MTVMMDPAINPDAAITVLPPLSEPSSADEINHRIANSLQLLSAMVSIEARAIQDPAARAALDMTRRRIGAIAGVHRQLYRTHDAAAVNLGTYLDELGDDLAQGCADAGCQVIVRADDVMAAPEEATAIGIIVSELVTNAAKYAYAPGTPGELRITLIGMPCGGYRLQVDDDGVGLADGAARGTGLGGRLIAMMAARLGACHAWHDRHPGTRFVLSVARR